MEVVLPGDRQSGTPTHGLPDALGGLVVIPDAALAELQTDAVVETGVSPFSSQKIL